MVEWMKKVNSDIQKNNESLNVLASSVGGRMLRVDRVDTAYSWTDGNVIYLPTEKSDNDKTMIIAQSLLIGGNSLQKKLLKRIRKSSANVKARFIALEVHRISTEYSFCLPKKFCNEVSELSSGYLSKSPEESLNQAEKMSLWNGADQNILGTIKPNKVIGFEPAVGGRELTDKEIESALAQKIHKKDNDDDEEKDESTFLKKMSLSIFSDSSVSKMLREMFGMSSSPDTDDKGSSNEGTDLDVAGAQMANKLSSGAKIVAKAFGFNFDELVSAGGTQYPEWDFEKETYREDWCCVHHFDADVMSAENIPNINPDLQLRKKIAKLNTEYRRHRRQPDGDDLDNDGVIEFFVDRLAGVSGNELSLFQNTKKTGRNLGVVVLIDASESTQDNVQDGTPIWDMQRELAFNLISALDEMGDGVAAYGFRSYGRNDVRLLKIKQFSNHFDQEARGRLFSIKPGGFTRLGAAIRHASHLVATEAGTSNQLVVVVSDGIPFDMQYDKDYAQADVRKALEESINSGVACVCLSVGSSVDADVIAQVWDNVAHATFNSPAELSFSVDKLFRSAIQRAESSANIHRKVRVEV